MRLIGFRFHTRLTKCAAIFAAYFVLVGGVAGQEVTFRSDDNAVAVQGRFLAFDGVAATVLTDGGPVTFRANGMVCEGDGCPNLQAYVPELTLVSEARVGAVLMPALVDVYGRDSGLTAQEQGGVWVLSAFDQPVLRVSIEVAPFADGFDRLVAHDADILVSMRELQKDALDRAFEAGLGRLAQSGQARILALDALVPVISPSSELRRISLSDLSGVLSGDDADLTVVLPDVLDGQLQGFADRFLDPAGAAFSQGDRVAEDQVIDAVETGENVVGLVPFGQTRNAQPLALTGPCGLVSQARFLTLKTEDYPLTFPVYLYLPERRQHPQVEDFLNWLRSPSAQLVIRRAGFVDLAAVPIPLGAQGDRLANAIANAGPEVPLGELQRMVRILQPRTRMSSTFRFEPGSTRLDGQSRSNVMQLAQALRDGRFAGREVLFVGFSDGRGPADANRDLSAARAEAVLRGVERALGGDVPGNVVLDTEAFGEALPMACDDSSWGQQTNRRVELWVRDLP